MAFLLCWMTYGGGTQYNGFGEQHVVAGFEPRALWLSGVCSANRATRIPQGNLILTGGDLNRLSYRHLVCELNTCISAACMQSAVDVHLWTYHSTHFR